MNHVPECKHEAKNTFSLRIKYVTKFVKPTIATTHIYVYACLVMCEWVCVYVQKVVVQKVNGEKLLHI